MNNKENLSGQILTDIMEEYKSSGYWVYEQDMFINK